MRDLFNRIAAGVTHRVGSPYALLLAVLVIVVWAATGPLFHFSDTWQLVINTSTTIVTFLMVFVIQATQNRDSRAIHLKLDELIRVNELARDEFITTEEDTEAVVARRAAEFAELAAREAQAHREGTHMVDPASEQHARLEEAERPSIASATTQP